jgi:hypothetical protein
VGPFEGVGNLGAHPHRLLRGERTLAEAVGEGLALKELHHEVVGPVLLPHVEQGADVGMVEGRDRPRLTLEALAELGVVGERFGEDLHRDVAGEAAVPRPVDLPHASRPQGSENLVGAEAAADREHGDRAGL